MLPNTTVHINISESKQVNSLVINSLLAGSHSVDPSIKICPPKSLAEWKIQHGMDYQIENQETSNKCKVKIPEPKR